MTKVFILGATGYIGGAVLGALLQEWQDVQVTALVRNKAAVDALSKAGINAIQGSHADLEMITDLTSKADIVINAGDADELNVANAILKGSKNSFDQGKKVLLIHTSGVMVVQDNATGSFEPSAPIYDDRDVEAVKSLPPTADHRHVESVIAAADEEGYVSAYILSPSAIYGQASAPIPRVSLLSSWMIQMAPSFKSVPFVGEGSNVMNYIHIKDVASAYLTVIKYALSGQDKEAGFGKYYFVVGPEIPRRVVSNTFAALLHEKGITESSEGVRVETSLPYLGTNARAFPGRLVQLGWRFNSPSLFDEVKGDVEFALSRQ